MTISLKAKLRKEVGKKTKSIKKAGKIPAVVYGPAIKNILVEVDEKEFKKVFSQAGESSLIDLDVEGEKSKKPVLIHDLQKDPLTDKFIHIDFFQPSLTEEVQATVPLVFEGVAPAEKDLGGTLVKNIAEVEVKALPQNLPHEIKVSVAGLLTFKDHILIKDLALPPNVKVLKKEDEIVASVAEPKKVEEELAVPIEEKVEEVEKVEKPKKEEEVVEGTEEKA